MKALIIRRTCLGAAALWVVVTVPAVGAGKVGMPSNAQQASSALPGQMDVIRTYCSNIRDLAKDTRHRLQFNELESLAKKVDVKVEELKVRTAEFKKWYDLRRKFAEKATVSLVQIYSRMRPESAAAQFSAMNELTAAALIIKLDTRIASAILNEIEPKKAASLSQLIAAAARKMKPGDPS